MAEIEGFEPPQDVNPLLVFKTSPFSQTWVNLRNSNGGPCRTRTYDRSVNSRLLYQLSYRGILMERETRFELATPALARRCSTAELFPHVVDDDRIELPTSCL